MLQRSSVPSGHGACPGAVLACTGKPKSIRETFDEVFQSIPYCIQLAGGPYIETKPETVKAFRPPADRRSAKEN
jgi:molybdopterin adenylyltransferase